MQTPTPAHAKPPSILKSLALAVGTLTLSTWALGTLWMQAEAPSTTNAATTNAAAVHVNPPANPAVVASNAP